MNFDELRRRMVVEQLVPRGIRDEKVLAAFYKVPREQFVEINSVKKSYEDYPLSIGCNQTISQPYIVALMTQLLELKGNEKVLEIGTGSGYQAAILAELVMQVYSVERIKELADSAAKALKRLGYANILIKNGDGSEGWKEFAPFDCIIVTAASPKVPDALVEQLNANGRLVIPVGEHSSQVLTLVRKLENRVDTENICGCVFVPLIGRQGWHA